MGRRKIEIKAIKDDRNRSVTFLKRKGGLFKKAHELSVLCSVDVAVFIFGSNKKLYEYSSCDMRELITRYTYHGGPNEHKGPSDFNGGNDDDEDEDGEGTPPHGEAVEPHMIPPQFPGQPPYQHMRHHTPSASPPIPNGVPFQSHPGHPVQRGHTPQPPHIGSRPSSRNDIRRMGGPGMMQQPVGPPGPPQQPVNGYAFMPNPAIYNPQNPQPMPPNMQPHGLPAPQYPYPPPQPHPHQMQPYVEDQRRQSLPPAYPPPPPQQGPPISVSRPEPSPPMPHPQQLPPHPLPHISPPQPQPQQLPPHPPQDLQPPAPMEPKPEEPQRPQPPLLNTDTAIKKLPQRKQHSIFTPIDENRSILQQHLASFTSDPQTKSESLLGRSQSVDVGAVSRNGAITSSPPMPQRANTQTHMKARNSVPTIPEAGFTPPSRANSFKLGGGGARPRLTVQIPDEASDAGSATAESNSPRNSTDATSQSTRRATDSHSSNMVLPPPSPSASALLSAGATGPPNPFARPPPQTQANGSSMHIDTPVSALPSRFLGTEFLPSPNSFYNDWNFRGSDSNTLPSPLNFATPVVGSGPSFLRDDNAATGKRKSPEAGAGAPTEGADLGNEPKRIKVD